MTCGLDGIHAYLLQKNHLVTRESSCARAAYLSQPSDEFIVRVAHDLNEACELVEAGFNYVTGEYSDGGKVFRKRK